MYKSPSDKPTVLVGAKRNSPNPTPRPAEEHDQPLEMSIVSWNIHDTMTRLEGAKSEDPDFVQILEKSTIFCLQETKQEFFLPNYKCFNSNRAGSRSGGVCIGVHRSIIHQVKPVDTECPDFQAITIIPKDENEESRLTIINVYDQGQKFVAVGAESRFLAFTATNRDIWHMPRQIAIISLFRDKSRFSLFSASDRDFIYS